MDALSDVLKVAHLTGGVFLHAEFFAPWCTGGRIAPDLCAPAVGPASHLIIYHYVVEGELRIRIAGEDGKDLVIGAGELVLLPRNDPHLMGSDLGPKWMPGEKKTSKMVFIGIDLPREILEQGLKQCVA